MAPKNWQEPNGVYLDFVTYVQRSEYWRSYIGQSNQPRERIPQMTLSLAEIEHDVWIEISQHKITRILIRAPAPFSELWTKYGKNRHFN